MPEYRFSLTRIFPYKGNNRRFFHCATIYVRYILMQWNIKGSLPESNLKEIMNFHKCKPRTILPFRSVALAKVTFPSISIKKKNKHLRTRVGVFNNQGPFVSLLVFIFRFSTIECHYIKHLTNLRGFPLFLVCRMFFQCKISSMNSSNLNNLPGWHTEN